MVNDTSTDLSTTHSPMPKNPLVKFRSVLLGIIGTTIAFTLIRALGGKQEWDRKESMGEGERREWRERGGGG